MGNSSSAGDPLACLADDEFGDFLDKAERGAWFLAGHTRAATMGAVVDKNAHPFRYGRIIGAHNGIVYPPKNARYRVDSEYLIDNLARCNGDYQTALQNVRGYWALTWFDGARFYLQAHRNEIAIGRDRRGVWYYSSDWTHLDACARVAKTELLKDGDTIAFDIKGKLTRLPKFESKTRAEIVIWKEREPGKGSTLDDRLFGFDDKAIASAKRRDKRRARRNHKDVLVELDERDPFYYDDDTEKWAR